ncbi:hypothetical protein [Streptomyces harbinensis]|uniref:hypothetical protein n=1 Tax=Streptomyces harbinensis TaxID=1176198 RepID=UPI0034E00039
MPTYEQLYNLNLTNLETAAEDWSSLASSLGELSQAAQEGLLARVEPLDWRGETAEAAKPLLTATGRRFSHAHEIAAAIHDVLLTLADKQRSARNDLVALSEEAAQLDLSIRYPDGAVYLRSNHGYTDEYLEQLDRHGTGLQDPGRQGDVDYITRRIAEILGNSEEADTTAARALYDLVGEEGAPFAAPSADGWETAERQQGYADALEVIELYETGEHKTPEGLARMNELFETNQDNESFAVHFATRMGADGVLGFWSDMALLGTDQEPTDEYVQSVAQLRENLGTTLGLATRSGDYRMGAWEADVIARGTDPYGHGYENTLTGFQIMSDLMRFGEYDAGYLTAYGDALVAFEQPEGEGHRWATPTGVALPGLGFAYDPATGLMNALSHNPEAATQFFLSGNPQDNAVYFIEERTYAPGESDEVLKAVGEALYAATTGVNPDLSHPYPPDHSPEQQRLFRRTLEIGSGMEDDFPPELRESMARMLGDYRSDVHATARNHSGGDLPLDAAQLSEIANQISRSPESYEILQTSMVIEYAEQIEADTTGDPVYVLDDIARSIGFLEQGRYAALEIDKDDSSWAGKNLYNFIGATLGDTPYIGTQLQHSVDQLTSRWVDWANSTTEADLRRSRAEYYTEGNSFLNGIAEQWLADNPAPPGVSEDKWIDRANQTVRDAANAGHLGAVNSTGDRDD